MGLYSKISGFFEKRWHPLRDYIITSWLMSSGSSDTGQVITPDVAMGASAVLACVDIISSKLSTIPLKIIQRKDKKEIEDHPLVPLLNASYNAEMTAAAGRQAMLVNLLLWGNAFEFIEKGAAARPVALWPLRSQTTTPQRYPGSELFYSSVTGGATYTFSPDQVLHVPDISYDGITGLSRVRYAANAIGLSLAMEKYGAKFFNNGGNPGGIVELPPGMKKEAVEAFKKSWRENYTGLDNSLKTALLTDGMKYTRTGIEPSKSQMIDTRVFQVREVARIFRMPLHKLAELEDVNFSTTEEMNEEFKEDCLDPWARKIAQEYERKLLLESEKGELCICHDFDSLLRANMSTRYAAYHNALTDGWMTRNEVRRRENLPPIDGGDTPLQQLNMGAATPGPGEPKPGAKPASGKGKKAKVKVGAEDDDENEDNENE